MCIRVQSNIFMCVNSFLVPTSSMCAKSLAVSTSFSVLSLSLTLLLLSLARSLAALFLARSLATLACSLSCCSLSCCSLSCLLLSPSLSLSCLLTCCCLTLSLSPSLPLPHAFFFSRSLCLLWSKFTKSWSQVTGS